MGAPLPAKPSRTLHRILQCVSLDMIRHRIGENHHAIAIGGNDVLTSAKHGLIGARRMLELYLADPATFVALAPPDN